MRQNYPENLFCDNIESAISGTKVMFNKRNEANENRLKWSWKGPLVYEQNRRNKIRRVHPVYVEPVEYPLA
ncbi:hypothetical protein T10_5315 [Trichinella papuae]|uniref:Uncharacterized protein n=1 Tax=Trichinella papuae TaxID=268474 RepID=A0A0V1M243_9BILA|nr:hypothetical protein T10_5315 [Trichinella papuae]